MPRRLLRNSNPMVAYRLIRACVVMSAIGVTMASHVWSQNLLANPGFESGATGFASSYALQTDLFPEGTYYVGTDPALYHPLASSFGDHTTGSGNMLIVNGAPTPITAWQQTVTVSPGYAYTFSGWATSWLGPTDPSPAVLQLSINGTVIGSTTTPGTPDSWTRYIGTWKSGSATSATLTLVDLNTTMLGNDFALDDFTFFLGVYADANDDGMVSGADYTRWADNFGAGPGATLAQGDFNCDGFVSGADYTIWAETFGESGLSPPSPVPEPSGVLTAAIGMAILGVAARGFRRTVSTRASHGVPG